MTNGALNTMNTPRDSPRTATSLGFPKERNVMRIAAYNILNGGVGRLDPLAETLGVIDADVVALSEANDEEGVEYLARRLGADYAFGESPTSAFAVAVLSRLPIVEAVNLGARHLTLDRAAMAVEVEANGKLVRVVALHLTPGLGRDKEMHRLGEMRLILDDVLRSEMQTVLAGDFNTNAAHHPLDVEAAEPGVRARLEADRTLAAHDLVDYLMSRGWVDAYHRAHPDDPEHTFTTAYPSTRLDYIFVDGGLASGVTGAGVEQRGLAAYCSDHFPIWAEVTV